MTNLSFEQQQAALARGRGLQSQAIRAAFSALYHLPGRLVEAFGKRNAATAASHKGPHAA